MRPVKSANSNSDKEVAQSIFAQLNRPIWIVTASGRSGRGGLVATWVIQASIDPARPALMAGLAANHFTRGLVLESGTLAVHLLRREQLDIVWNFALGSGRDRDKVAVIPHRIGGTGSPILSDCLAWMDCRVLRAFDGVDRTYFLTEVVGAGQGEPGELLRERDVFEAATPAQRAQLQADMQQDIQISRQAFVTVAGSDAAMRP